MLERIHTFIKSSVLKYVDLDNYKGQIFPIFTALSKRHFNFLLHICKSNFRSARFLIRLQAQNVSLITIIILAMLSARR